MGFVFEWAGKTLYFMDDSGFDSTFEFVADYYKPDAVIVPIGDIYTMGPKLAAYMVNKYFAQCRIIPCHYATFPILAQDAGSFTSLLDDSSKVDVIAPMGRVSL